MQGKSQILSLKKSLLMITGHSAIEAGISLIPLPQEWPGLESYVLVNFLDSLPNVSRYSNTSLEFLKKKSRKALRPTQTWAEIYKNISHYWCQQFSENFSRNKIWDLPNEQKLKDYFLFFLFKRRFYELFLRIIVIMFKRVS